MNQSGFNGDVSFRLVSTFHGFSLRWWWQVSLVPSPLGSTKASDSSTRSSSSFSFVPLANKQSFARWWQLKYFWNFHPYLGKISKFLKLSFFSSWWLNQPNWKICSSKWVHLPQVGVKIQNVGNHPFYDAQREPLKRFQFWLYDIYIYVELCMYIYIYLLGCPWYLVNGL